MIHLSSISLKVKYDSFSHNFTNLSLTLFSKLLTVFLFIEIIFDICMDSKSIENNLIISLRFLFRNFGMIYIFILHKKILNLLII